MGLQCKPVGKLKGVFTKVENEVNGSKAKEKLLANLVNKTAKKAGK